MILLEAPLSGVLVSGRTLFLPLGALYPECDLLRQGHPRIPPLACLQDGGCHLGVSTRCMETLARRLGRLFEAHPALELVVLHWTRAGGEPWGTRFDRAFSPPTVARLRAASLRYYLLHGQRFPIPRELLD